MKKKRKKERWKPRGTQKNNQNQTRRRKHRQRRESVRERGEIQPIRDEMELLESERRIFIPGCCTEKREKRERGKKKKGNKEKLRIMHHAILRFLFKKEWTERGRGEDVCVYRNKTWRDKMMMKIESFGIDRGWARREMTDWGREMETGREKHHSEEHNNYTDVTGRKHWIEKWDGTLHCITCWQKN